MASILRLQQVLDRVGLSRSFIYLAVANGTFPALISLGPRATGWDEADIDRWIAEQKGKRRAPRSRARSDDGGAE